MTIVFTLLLIGLLTWRSGSKGNCNVKIIQFARPFSLMALWLKETGEARKPNTFSCNFASLHFSL